jgi:hypothetical protein
MNQQHEGEKQRDSRNPIHGLPQLVACLDVEKRHGEEDGGVDEHQQILHRRTPDSAQRRTLKRAESHRLSFRLRALEG